MVSNLQLQITSTTCEQNWLVHCGVCSIAYSTKSKNDKLFLNPTRFPNDPCPAQVAGEVEGICYSAEECAKKSGVASGLCANGFGVCCLCKYCRSRLMWSFSARPKLKTLTEYYHHPTYLLSNLYQFYLFKIDHIKWPIYISSQYKLLSL